jgi:mannose-6-phosphate isomerase-like protein (cupin superfamily)
LIQILCINAGEPADTELAVQKARRVNRAGAGAERERAAFGSADTAFRSWENRDSAASALYRAVTLSPVAHENLGKVLRPCLHASGNSEVVMKSILWSLPAILCLMTAPASAEDKARINPTDPQPTCNMCPGTYIPAAELDAYTRKALAEKLLDQQVRDVDIGKANIGIGMVHRDRLEKPKPDSVAEHDHVSEVYHVISGAATLVLGPDIVNRQRRPANMRTVVEFNGPGNNGSEVRDGTAYEIKAGDVVVIPAGTGHWFTAIEDHIDYLMVRIDPDKLTPLKSEAQSQEYLAKPAKRGE